MSFQTLDITTLAVTTLAHRFNFASITIIGGLQEVLNLLPFLLLVVWRVTVAARVIYRAIGLHVASYHWDSSVCAVAYIASASAWLAHCKP